MTSKQNLVLGLIIGNITGVLIGTIIFVCVGVVPKSAELKSACEKDLTRNLKCEMVYVKPSIK